MQTEWEVEQKFVVNDVPELRERLAANGFGSIGLENNRDVYFRHPCRDFKATEEAFRLRALDESSCITYKGKRLPGPVKSRPEIELSIAQIDREQWLTMLVQLGFTPLPPVAKRRETFAHRASANLPLPSGSLAAALRVTIDEVELLGSFSEIELVVSSESELSRAAEHVQRVAEQLGLVTVQPRSYLSLLLAKLNIE